MKALKAFGTLLLFCLFGLAIGLFLVIGVAFLALGDLIRFTGRRFKERLRGDRFKPNSYVPVRYDGPRLVMDADGFVEPPAVRELAYGGLVRRGGALTVTPSPSSAARRNTASVLAVRTPQVGRKILYFPVDAAARERFQIARGTTTIDAPVGGGKVIYFASYLRRNKR
jgi:hypothetical protein